MNGAISMVLLESDLELDGQAFFDDFAERWAGDESNTPAPAGLDMGEGVSFNVGEASVIAMMMQTPIPWSTLEAPCGTSVLWKNATEEIQRHKVHVIITVIGSTDAIASSVLLTQATVSLMEVTSAMGVYWCNASMVIPRSIFNDFAAEVMPHGPPLYIWVNFRVGMQDARRSSGFTVGMHALDHREFTATGAKEPPVELRDRFVGLCEFVLKNGPVINDGDTIGEDAHEKIRVVYGESEFGHEEEVMKLVYDTASPEKPWRNLW